jgi:NAD(P)-dependent dehydrogenase (short-subunit alcohol dehydrogenase family)
MRLKGKSALVTGAASGLGEGIARRFAREGAMVLAADIDEAAGSWVAADLGSAARFVHLDVTSEESWSSALQHAPALDILVNNAGIVTMANIEQITAEIYRRDMDVDVLGVLLGCKHGIAAMRAGGGTIINMASAVAKRAEPEMVAYSGAKAAVCNITRAVALHCAGQGYAIRCNAILPGIIHTSMVDKALSQVPEPEEAYRRWCAKQPVGRLGRIEEVAAVAVHLASDESEFMTGSEILVAGGNGI